MSSSENAPVGATEPVPTPEVKHQKPKSDLMTVLRKAGRRALGGGLPGFISMILQVVLLMWLRTLVNYQYSKGGTFREAFRFVDRISTLETDRVFLF